MPNYDVLASQEAARLGVHRSTIIDAIRAGRCGGEERGGHWYTSEAAAEKWYADHYRHAGAVYSQTAGKNWDEQEPELLRLVGEGATPEEIAVALKRSVAAVKTKLSKMRATDAVPPARRGRPPKAESAAPQPPFLPGPTPEQIAAARQLVAEDDARRQQPRTGYAYPQRPADAPAASYEERRAADKDGRIRLHLAPAVKLALKAGLDRYNRGRPEDDRLTLTQLLGWAGLAALDDPEIINRGRDLSYNLRD